MKKELATKISSRLTLCFCLVVGTMIVLQLIHNISPRNSFPAREQRVDIQYLHMAAYKDLCNQKDVESCLKSLEKEGNVLERTTQVRLPDLPYMVERKERFSQILAREHPELSQRMRSRQELFLARFTVPRRFFNQSPSSRNPMSLAMFGTFESGRLCVANQCDTYIFRWGESLQEFPLISNEAASYPDENVPVWIVAPGSGERDWLSHAFGLFITSSDNLFRLKWKVVVRKYGNTILQILLPINLIALAGVFALLWWRYLDYIVYIFLNIVVALSFFVTSQFLMTDDLSLFAGPLFNMLIISFLTTCIALSLATGRASHRKIILCLALGPVLGILSAIFVGFSFPDYLAIWRKNARLYGYAFLLLPTLISLYSVIFCFIKWMSNRGLEGAFSFRIDFGRRAIQQFLMFVCFLLIGWDVFRGANQMTFSGNPALLFPGRMPLYLAVIFGVLFFHSTLRMFKTVFNTQRDSEVERLRERLSAKNFAKWLARPRDGILVTVDLKNSSRTTSVHDSGMHHLMFDVLRVIKQEQAKHGQHRLLVKRAGDEWGILLARKFETVEEDLKLAAESLQDIAPKLDQITRKFDAECSVHICVYAFDRFSLRPPEQSESTEDLSTVDFVSEEANFLMKYCHKPSQENHVLVAGKKKFVQALNDDLSQVSSRVRQAGKQDSLARIDELDLSYLEIPWSQI